MVESKNKSPKEKCYELIRIVPAQTDLGLMFSESVDKYTSLQPSIFLISFNTDFIAIVP